MKLEYGEFLPYGIFTPTGVNLSCIDKFTPGGLDISMHGFISTAKYSALFFLHPWHIFTSRQFHILAGIFTPGEFVYKKPFFSKKIHGGWVENTL